MALGIAIVCLTLPFSGRWLGHRVSGLLQACGVVLDPRWACLLCRRPEHDWRLAAGDIKEDEGRGEAEGTRSQQPVKGWFYVLLKNI